MTLGFDAAPRHLGTKPPSLYPTPLHCAILEVVHRVEEEEEEKRKSKRFL
jgi:hypothetical protein